MLPEDYSFNDKQQNQTLRFIIEYNEDNHLAVSEFIEALNGLNQLYSSFAHQQKRSKETNLLEDRIKEKEIGQFYIKEINNGCIDCSLIAKGFFNLVSFLGNISNIIDLASRLKEKREKDITHSENTESNDCPVNNSNYNDLKSLVKLIKPIKDGQPITIIVGKESIKLNINQKQLVESELDRLQSQLSLYRKNLSPFNNVGEFVQIEYNKGKYYATIIQNKLTPSIKLPVKIHTSISPYKKYHKNYKYKDLVFFADIKYSHSDNCYHIYQIFDILRWQDLASWW